MRLFSKFLIILVFVGLAIVVGVNADIPPTPIILSNTTSNYWVNYTWTAGSGNVTDSYNISVNDIWVSNSSSQTYWNSNVGPSNWSNIAIYAYNVSGGGNLNLTPANNNTQAPAAPISKYIPPTPIILSNTTSNYWVNYTWTAGSGNVTDSYNISVNDIWVSNSSSQTYWNSNVGPSNWSNIAIYAYNVSGGGNLNLTPANNNTQAPAAPISKYIPPTPIILSNTTSNYWVNYTWTAGSGNVTDSYNISINGSWTNGTSATFKNSTVGPHGYAEIIVYAFNSSGSGTLSVGNLTDNVTVPNNPIDITNTSDRTVNEGENVYVDFDYTDDDSDTGTFTCNRNDLFSDFDTATGKGNWLTNYSSDGTYSVVFGVSDGYGSTVSYTMTITVNDVDSPSPVISNVNNDTASNNSVTIYWDTDIPSDSLVKYGTTENILNNETNDPTLVTNHYIVLTNLEDNTTYYYVVNSTSAFDKSNQSDDIKTFTTTDINDITPPVINDKSLSKTSSVKSGETLTVTINVIDNIGVTSVTASNNDLTRRNATHWSGTVTADSTKKVDIIAYDAAGNTNTTTLTYTLYTSSGGGGGGGVFANFLGLHLFPCIGIVIVTIKID